MSDSAQAAIIAALKSAQDQFRAAGQQYGRLYHAVLEGAAIHDQQCVREYLKAVIADGAPFQQHYSTIGTPCGFYFGEDIEAAELFDRIAGQVYDLLDDGTGQPDAGIAGNPLYGLPEIPGWLLDHGKAGALLWWMYWLGDKYSIPTIKAQRGELIKDDGAIPGTALDGKRLGRPAIRLPNGQSCQGESWPVLPEKPWDHVEYPDGFSYLWRAVHFSEIGEVCIYRRSVFLCAQVGIGVLIDHIERAATPAAINVGASLPAAGEIDASGSAADVAAELKPSGWWTAKQAQDETKINRGVIYKHRAEIGFTGEGKDRRYNPAGVRKFAREHAPKPKKAPTITPAKKSRVSWQCPRCHKLFDDGQNSPEYCPGCHVKLNPTTRT
ncbi:MAG: hypothetical protein ACM359_12175 [Bacillota bacterium]